MPEKTSGFGLTRDDRRHPFIAGLLRELPPDGADWPILDRVKWLQTAAILFEFIYKNGDNAARPLKIEAEADGAGSEG